MKSNLDIQMLGDCAQIAKEIRHWIEGKDHPEYYQEVTNLELVCKFLHCLDLLETILGHLEISVFLIGQAFDQQKITVSEDSIMYVFNQIDVEEYFASNLLEFCYQIDNGCREIEKIANNEQRLQIFSKPLPSFGKIHLARNKVTHFQPDQFEEHNIAKKYSILRRPYKVVDGKLQKELAGQTMPRVAKLLKDSVSETYRYLALLRESSIG